MVDVRDKTELRAWLEKQSTEHICLIASRAALRVTPLIAKSHASFENLPSQTEAIILPTFWTIASSLTANLYPTKMASGYTFEAIKTTYVASEENLETDYAALTAARAATAAEAASAQSAVDTVEYVYLAIQGANTTYFYFANATYADDTDANTARSVESEMMWAALRSDIQAVSDHTQANTLRHAPLWPVQNRPDKILEQWGTLRRSLLLKDPNWSVWTEWYDALLEGNAPFIEEIEIGDPENDLYGRCTFPKEYYQDPPRLNAALREVIDNYWAKQEKHLSQDPTAEVFDSTEDGKIDVVTQPIGQGLTDTEDQRAWYEALRENLTDALLAGQQLGQAKAPLEKLRQALPENINDARVARLWPRANKIRRMLAKHEIAAQSEDFNSDKLDSAVATELDGIVGAYNNLRINDPNLIAADENAKSPQEIEDLIAGHKKVKTLIADAKASGILTPEAETILDESAETLSEIGLHNEIMGQMAAETAAKTERNFLRKAVSIARDGGALYAAGKGAKEITEFVIRNKDTIGEILKNCGSILRDLLL